MNAPASDTPGKRRERGNQLPIRGGLMKCPCCHSKAIIRDSEEITPLVRELYHICLNSECGHTWKAQLEYLYELSPSAIDHQIDLPQPPEGYQRKRFPAGARQPGEDPGDPRQVTIFDHLDRDQAAA